MDKKEPNKEKDRDFSITNMITDIKNKNKKMEKLSEIVDYVVEEAMPKIFGENIEKAYKNSKKTADFIMRHII